MSAFLKVIGIMLLCAVAYLSLWPVPIKPVAWQALVNPGYSGEFAVNDKLEQPEKLSLGGLTGPEAATHDANGNLYATTHEGWIIRWPVGASAPEKWVNAEGRPLGIAFDAQGDLWVANAYIGLQRVSASKIISTELTEVDGVAIRYADDVVVAPNGKVYFSDASTRFSAKEEGGTLPASLLDLMEHSDNGRVIEFDPSSKESRVVLDGLTFANGVTLDPNGQFLLVVETGEYKVIKLWLAGEKKGQTEVIIDNLPGFPDNIHRGKNGRYWLGLTAPRSEIVDSLSSKPFRRKVVQRLPASMHPQVVHYGMVVAIDENGQVLANLQSPSGEVYTTTGAAESDEFLYVTSLTAPFLAKYKKSELGLD